VIFQDLRALDYGDWSGLTKQDVMDSLPGDWENWFSDENWKEHGGESYRDLRGRVKRVISDVLETAKNEMMNHFNHTKTSGNLKSNINSKLPAICIVGHQSMVKCVLAELNGGGLQEYKSMSNVKQNSVTELEYWPDRHTNSSSCGRKKDKNSKTSLKTGSKSSLCQETDKLKDGTMPATGPPALLTLEKDPSKKSLTIIRIAKTA